MRIIKFRAWNEEQKYMAYQGTPDLETLQSFIFHFGDKELMQFTGLHDKNGKEIYEGDILKTFPIISSDKIAYDSFNVLVKFINSSWIANGILGKRQAEISEVIGSIYENPELL